VRDRRNCHAINAVLKIELEAKFTGVTWIPNQSYCSSMTRVFIAAWAVQGKIDRVTVWWPDSTGESFGPFNAGRLYESARRRGYKNLQMLVPLIEWADVNL